MLKVCRFKEIWNFQAINRVIKTSYRFWRNKTELSQIVATNYP